MPILRSARRATSPGLARSGRGSLVGILLAGLLALAAPRPGVAQDSTPSVEIDDEAVQFAEGFVDIPILISNASGADGLELSIDYDEMLLGYAFYAGTSENWSVRNVTRYADHRVIITLTNLARGAGPGDDVVLHTLFVLKGGPLDGDGRSRFKAEARLSLGTPSAVPTTSGTHFFLEDSEENREPLLTDLRSATVSIYYENGVEVGWGAVTRVAQEFTLPLYLTYLKNDRNVFTCGIDYDEMFLNVLRIRGFSPPLADEVIDESPGTDKGSLRFDLVLDNGLDGPFVRLHVADIVFRYSGERPPDDEILVKATLLEGTAAQGEADGGGAAYGQTLPGIVTVLPPHFVRGNVDSSTRVGFDGKVNALPELSDVAQMLDSLFKGGSPLPCYDAADINDSGVLEIGDAILLLNYFYKGGDPPASPFPYPGMDEGFWDILGCETPVPYFESR